MKILFITHQFYPFVGGIEVNSEILALAFHNAGEDVHLITWTKASGNKKFPYKVIRNPNMTTLLKEHYWADIVYENNPSLRLSWPAILFKKPSVIALRTWVNRIDGSVGWQDKFKSFWLKRASSVIAVSEAVRKKSWPEATVIGNPYRNNLFRIIPEIQRNDTFVFLGRLVSDKGADLAIKAFKEIVEQKTTGNILITNYKFTIIGDGPDSQYLKDLVKNLSLEDQVEFTGSLKGEQLVACLNKHRFIIVPSLWEEPFGNVALEGIACGCVPIVSDGGGLPDAIGNAGLIFERGNVHALLNCLHLITNNPQMEQHFRDVAATHLKAHHPEKVAAKYLAVIKKAFYN